MGQCVVRENIPAERDPFEECFSLSGIDSERLRTLDKISARGFTVESLLELVCLLHNPQRAWEEIPNLRSKLTSYAQFSQVKDLPDLSFFSSESTTRDVAYKAIVPLSRHAESAYATIMMEGQTCYPQAIITHSWGNRFIHTVAACLADAVSCYFEKSKRNNRSRQAHYYEYIPILQSYDRIKDFLRQERTTRVYAGREYSVDYSRCFRRTYWLCVVSINQHTIGCATEGNCQCAVVKVLDNNDPRCEIGHFHEMMRYIVLKQPNFYQVIAVDIQGNVLNRTWAIAEIAEVYNSDLYQEVCVHCPLGLAGPRIGRCISELDVEKAEATLPQDRDMILSGIPDAKEYNQKVKAALRRPFALPVSKLFVDHAQCCGSCLGTLIVRRILISCGVFPPIVSFLWLSSWMPATALSAKVFALAIICGAASQSLAFPAWLRASPKSPPLRYVIMVAPCSLTMVKLVSCMCGDTFFAWYAQEPSDSNYTWTIGFAFGVFGATCALKLYTEHFWCLYAPLLATQHCDKFGWQADYEHGLDFKGRRPEGRHWDDFWFDLGGEIQQHLSPENRRFGSAFFLEVVVNHSFSKFDALPQLLHAFIFEHTFRFWPLTLARLLAASWKYEAFITIACLLVCVWGGGATFGRDRDEVAVGICAWMVLAPDFLAGFLAFVLSFFVSPAMLMSDKAACIVSLFAVVLASLFVLKHTIRGQIRFTITWFFMHKMTDYNWNRRMTQEPCEATESDEVPQDPAAKAVFECEVEEDSYDCVIL